MALANEPLIRPAAVLLLATLTGVEAQSARYAQGLPASLPAWHRPLPFAYESTGIETHFTNGLDPAPRARNVFAFHRPEMLAEWLSAVSYATRVSTRDDATAHSTDFATQSFLTRLQRMPELVTEWGMNWTGLSNGERLIASACGRDFWRKPRPGATGCGWSTRIAP